MGQASKQKKKRRSCIPDLLKMAAAPIWEPLGTERGSAGLNWPYSVPRCCQHMGVDKISVLPRVANSAPLTRCVVPTSPQKRSQHFHNVRVREVIEISDDDGGCDGNGGGSDNYAGESYGDYHDGNGGGST